MPTPDDPLAPGYYTPGQPTPLVPPILAPVRNFVPPPPTPDYFGRSDQPGSRAQHQVSPSDYDRPGGTQTSAMPVPPRAPPGENIDQPTPPTPAAYRPSPLYQPLPWRTQQPPPAQPAPPAGDWDHENEHPDMPQPRPIPAQAQPNRDPDGYHNGRPVYHLRPGEQGYGVGGSNSLSGVVAKLESDYGRDNAQQPRSMANPTYGQYPGFVATYGSGPQGITNYANQILRYNPNATLGDFYAGYAQGTGNPAYPPTLADLARNYPAYYTNLVKNSPYPISTPLASLMGGVVAGPPQAYVPPQPREASQWGRPPEHDWTPGRMPTQHDVPNIMKGLLPLIGTILIGFAGKGALGAVTAFGAYQNARNKGQLEAAKEQKNYWKNHLEETASALQDEALGASGVVAQYGYNVSSPQGRQAWSDLAEQYDDPQLRAAIANGDSGAIERLFKNRDVVYQNIKKTSAAQDKADEQASEKDAGVAAEQSPYPGQKDNPPPAGLPGERPRPATPAAQGGWLAPPASPAPQSAIPGQAPSQADAAAPPAEAPAPSEATPSSAVPPSSEAAPPAVGMVRPASWVSPAAAGGPGSWLAPPSAAPGSQSGDPVIQPGSPDALRPGRPPPPDTLPDVGVGGLAPWDNRGPLGQGVTGLSPERLDQDARTYLEIGKPLYHGGPSGDPLAVPRNEAVARRAAQMQSFIDRTIRETKPGDIDGALQKIDTVDPNLAAQARIVDHGDGPPPTGWQRGVPFYRNVMRIVNSLDPTWDATRWVTNYRTKVAFSSGTQSTQVASMNRALQHMEVLMDTAKQLDNSDWPSWNMLANAVKTQLGSDAATNFTEARSAVARELERAFRGGSGAYGEIKADLDNVGANASKEQILGYIRISTELLKGQLDAMADLYQRGTRKATTGADLLSPQARNAYNRIMKGVPFNGEIDPKLGIAKVAGEAPDAELDQTATPPPASMSGPGPAPAPVDIPQGWVEQPQQ